MRLFNRRRFLLGTAGIFTASLAGYAGARDYQGGVPWEQGKALPPDRYNPAKRFLTDAERRFVTAAVDRLIPADDFPSASQLGVVDFIDHQLAGSYGRGDIFYLQEPFLEGTDSQGYQSRAPSWLYRRAIREIEGAIASNHDGKSFAELDEATQDSILTDLENGDLALPTASASTFFSLLLQNTKEGYFGDPIHGGNRDMEAWRMIGFPGARYDYRPYVARHNERLEFEPVSVAGFASRITPNSTE
ncbi:gluconate 2-dehydrogenase subunit 3 family protein [Nitratireductor sp. GISD-1A_MAKvit]|uniref:gluconate 2-dehydrogenase subunit 3 family protein n=1 Tax=Nitratireductor sp. GISD-1A_MAKvit TaxID=3234198 RepID=UPI003465AA68